MDLGSGIDDQWIDGALYRLAQSGWGDRRLAPTQDFCLDPASLPKPATAESMAAIIGQLYPHARKWAPGYNVPFNVPKISVSPFIDSAGQYRADQYGCLFVDVSPEFVGHHSALLAILAHEACHHILDLSGIRGKTTEENERLTDLAAFVCGFGRIVLDGHADTRSVGSGWVKVHLGYFSTEQYQHAQEWVLRSQGLPIPEGRHAEDVHPKGPRSFWRRLLGRAPVSAAPVESSGAARVKPPEFVDVTGQRRRTALARLRGDAALLDRLLEYEGRRHPGASQLELLDAVIESYERDRR